MQEEWRDVVGFEGVYQVSNLGRVKRIKKGKNTEVGKILKPRLTRTGYELIRICKNGVPLATTMHRIVAQAFIPNPENKPEVDHIDGNRQNNHADNLRWNTVKENRNNPITLKRKSVERKGKTGILCGNSKAILCVELNRLFWGCCEAERVLKIDQSSIAKAIKGIKYQTAGGYHWRYATDDDMRELAARCTV